MRLEEWLEAERGQLPLWLPVGLVGGVGAWFWLPTSAAWWGFLAAMVSVALLGLGFGGGGRTGRAIALFALSAGLGCTLIWLHAERSAAATLTRPMIAHFAARIVQVEPLPARDATRLLLRPAGIAHLPPLLRLTVRQEDAPPGLMPGAIVTIRARLLPPPSAAVPGAYDYSAVAWFQGIGATGRALDPVKVAVPAATGGPSVWLADARIALTRHILVELPGGKGGVAAALVTGDMGAVTFDDNDAFRRSGLAHLLSVSGLHLTAAVGATMFVALRLLALWPWLALRAPLLLIAAGIGAACGIAYTLLTRKDIAIKQ